MFTSSVKIVLLLSLSLAAVAQSDEQKVRDKQQELEHLRNSLEQKRKAKEAVERAGITIDRRATNDNSADCTFSYAEQPHDKEILHGPTAMWFWRIQKPLGEMESINGSASVKFKALVPGQYVVFLNIADKTGRWQQSFGHRFHVNPIVEWE